MPLRYRRTILRLTGPCIVIRRRAAASNTPAIPTIVRSKAAVSITARHISAKPMPAVGITATLAVLRVLRLWAEAVAAPAAMC